jgi:hypothetical protein
MQLEFPITWLSQTPSPTILESLKHICVGDIVAVTARTHELRSNLTNQHSYLMRRDDGFTALHWTVLTEKTKRRIAYAAMELSNKGLNQNVLQKHCAPLIDEERWNNVDKDILTVLMTPNAITVINDTRLDEIFTNLPDVTQEDVDQALLTLAFKPDVPSTHSVLLRQKEMNQLHDIYISHYIPEDIDMSVGQLGAPDRI